MTYSNRINLAIQAATRAHAGQFRRGSATPYIIHPYAVALITQEYYRDENLFIAALFHDVLEDVPSRVYSAEDIEQAFGSDVLSLVQDVTEPLVNEHHRGTSWQERKTGYLDHLASLSIDPRPLVLSGADKIHNMTELLRSRSEIGPRVWKFFHAPPEREIWFFEAVYNILAEKETPEQLLKDYRVLFDELRQYVDDPVG